MRAFIGFFQTTGWPAVVACIGHWFNKSSRGVIFGIWNSHTNVGNILGAVIAGAFVEYNWGLSFIVPGVIMGVCGFILFLFLVPCTYHLFVCNVWLLIVSCIQIQRKSEFHLKKFTARFVV